MCCKTCCATESAHIATHSASNSQLFMQRCQSRPSGPLLQRFPSGNKAQIDGQKSLVCWLRLSWPASSCTTKPAGLLSKLSWLFLGLSWGMTYTLLSAVVTTVNGWVCMQHLGILNADAQAMAETLTGGPEQTLHQSIWAPCLPRLGKHNVLFCKMQTCENFIIGRCIKMLMVPCSVLCGTRTRKLSAIA